MFRLFGIHKSRRRRSASCPNLAFEVADSADAYCEEKENVREGDSTDDSDVEEKRTLSRLERLKAQRSIRRPRQREKLKEENVQKNLISMDDYLAKLPDLKLWLKEEKHKKVDVLTSPKLKEYFKTFVRLWNKKKLPAQYYHTCSMDISEVEHSDVATLEYTPPTRPMRNPDTPASLSLFPTPMDLSLVFSKDEVTESPFSTFGKSGDDALSSPAAMVRQMDDTPTYSSKSLPRQLSNSSLSKSLQKYATISRGAPISHTVAPGEKEELRVHPVTTPTCPMVTSGAGRQARSSPGSKHFAASNETEFNHTASTRVYSHHSPPADQVCDAANTSDSPAYAQVQDAIPYSTGSPQYAQIDETGRPAIPESDYCSLSPRKYSPPYSALKKKQSKGLSRRRSKSMECIYSMPMKIYSPIEENNIPTINQWGLAKMKTPPIPERNYNISDTPPSAANQTASPEKTAKSITPSHHSPLRRGNTHHSPETNLCDESYKSKLKQSWLRFDSFLHKSHSKESVISGQHHRKEMSPPVHSLHASSPTKMSNSSSMIMKNPVKILTSHTSVAKSPVKRRSQDHTELSSGESVSSPKKGILVGTQIKNATSQSSLTTKSPLKRRSQDGTESGSGGSSSSTKKMKASATLSKSSHQPQNTMEVEPSPKYSILTGSLNPTTRRKNMEPEPTETNTEGKEAELSILHVEELQESPKFPRRRLKRRSSSFSTTPGKRLTFGKFSKHNTSSPRRVSFAKDVKGSDGSDSTPLRRRSSSKNIKQSQDRMDFESFLYSHVPIPARSASPSRNCSSKNSPQKTSSSSPKTSPSKNNYFSRMFHAESKPLPLASSSPSSSSNSGSLSKRFNPSSNAQMKEGNTYPLNISASPTFQASTKIRSLMKTFDSTKHPIQQQSNRSCSATEQRVRLKSNMQSNEVYTGTDNSAHMKTLKSPSPQKFNKVGEILFGIRHAQGKTNQTEARTTFDRHSQKHQENNHSGKEMAGLKTLKCSPQKSSPTKGHFQSPKKWMTDSKSSLSSKSSLTLPKPLNRVVSKVVGKAPGLCVTQGSESEGYTSSEESSVSQSSHKSGQYVKPSITSIPLDAHEDFSSSEHRLIDYADFGTSKHKPYYNNILTELSGEIEEPKTAMKDFTLLSHHISKSESDNGEKMDVIHLDMSPGSRRKQCAQSSTKTPNPWPHSANQGSKTDYTTSQPCTKQTSYVENSSEPCSKQTLIVENSTESYAKQTSNGENNTDQCIKQTSNEENSTKPYTKQSSNTDKGTEPIAETHLKTKYSKDSHQVERINRKDINTENEERTLLQKTGTSLCAESHPDHLKENSSQDDKTSHNDARCESSSTDSSLDANCLKRIESLRASPRVVDNDSWITCRRRSSKGKKESFRSVHNRYLLRSASRQVGEVQDGGEGDNESRKNSLTANKVTNNELKPQKSEETVNHATDSKAIDHHYHEKAPGNLVNKKLPLNEPSQIDYIRHEVVDSFKNNGTSPLVDAACSNDTDTEMDKPEPEGTSKDRTTSSASSSSATPKSEKSTSKTEPRREIPPPTKKRPMVLPKPVKSSTPASHKLNVAKFVNSMPAPKRKSSLLKRDLASATSASRHKENRVAASVVRRESSKRFSSQDNSTSTKSGTQTLTKVEIKPVPTTGKDSSAPRTTNTRRSSKVHLAPFAEKKKMFQQLQATSSSGPPISRKPTPLSPLKRPSTYNKPL